MRFFWRGVRSSRAAFFLRGDNQHIRRDLVARHARLGRLNRLVQAKALFLRTQSAKGENVAICILFGCGGHKPARSRTC